MTKIHGRRSRAGRGWMSRWWHGQRPLAVTGLVAVSGIAAIAAPALLERPTDQRAEEVDGRTWLALRRASGPTLVLANGISGLVEAQATSATDLPATVRFAGSDRRFTLLRGADQAVVVADGTHRASVAPLERGGTAALVDQSVLTIGADLVVRAISASGELQAPVTLEGAGQAVPGAQPVVDGQGAAWVMRQSGATRRAVRIGPDGVEASVALDGATSELVVIDGRAVARAGSRLIGLDGRDGPAVGEAAVIPSVAVATGGAWATATGTSIELTVAGSSRRIGAPRPVTRLAVWYGAVWASTDRGVLDTSGPTAAMVPGMDGPTSMFTDGGRLWFVNATTAAAVDRDQQVTVFRLTGVDLDLCVGDCSAEDAVRYGKQHLASTTTSAAPAPEQAPPTPPAPALTLPPLVPPAVSTTPTSSTSTTTTSSTSTTTTSTTAAPAAAAVAESPATDPPSPPQTTTTSAPPSPSSSSSLSLSEATLAPPFPLDTEPAPVDTTPPSPATDPPAGSTSTGPESTTSTAPPAHAGEVTLYFTDDSDPLLGGTTTVAFGFRGSGRDCLANGGQVADGHTVAEVTWDGSTSGHQRVDVDLGAEARTDVDIAPGSIRVTVTLCGLRASIDRHVSGDPPPELDEISLAGEPAEQSTVTATAAYRYTDGWVPSSRWAFGRCASTERIDGIDGPTETSASLRFEGSGRYCVRLTVTFRREGDRAVRSQSRRVDLGVTTVDTTPVSTSSTAESTVAPTDPPATDPPVTDPPASTAPPTTRPAPTDPPAFTVPTTLPPPTTQPPPTTRPPSTTTPPTSTTTPPSTSQPPTSQPPATGF